MINFAVGPVQSFEETCELGSHQVPYFRTSEFSETMKENERLFLSCLHAPKGSRAVFVTGSGTASMEAVVMNVLGSHDRALVVEGGSFGHRFARLCEIHDVDFTGIPLKAGKALTADDLAPYKDAGYTAFLVNLGETSTGILYDLKLIGDFCREQGLALVIDAVSSFLADELDMEACGAVAVITGSQKALALPPGLSLIALSPEGVRRAEGAQVRSMYFDLADALRNGERGQTPFTPAVGILLQLNERLRSIDSVGVDAERARIASIAADFRERIGAFPFRLFAETPSNAVTSLWTGDISAQLVTRTLKDEYGIWVCPNGGELADKLFRVGHIGNLTIADNDALFGALEDMRGRGLFQENRHA